LNDLGKTNIMRVIDLSGKEVNAELLAAVVESDFGSVGELRLDGCRLEDKTFLALVPLIKKMGGLKKLSLLDNAITSDKIHALMFWRNLNLSKLVIQHNPDFPDLYSPGYAGDAEARLNEITRAGGRQIRSFTTDGFSASEETVTGAQALTDLLTLSLQETNYSCGAAVTMKILQRFKIDAHTDEASMRAELETNSKVGTELEKIRDFLARQSGLFVLGGFSDHLQAATAAEKVSAMHELLGIATRFGIPMLVGIKEYQGHYVLFTKLTKNKVHYHDPESADTLGSDKHIKLKLADFDAKWLAPLSLHGGTVAGRQGGFALAVPQTGLYAAAIQDLKDWAARHQFDTERRASLAADENIWPGNLLPQRNRSLFSFSNSLPSSPSKEVVKTSLMQIPATQRVQTAGALAALSVIQRYDENFTEKNFVKAFANINNPTLEKISNFFIAQKNYLVAAGFSDQFGDTSEENISAAMTDLLALTTKLGVPLIIALRDTPDYVIVMAMENNIVTYLDPHARETKKMALDVLITKWFYDVALFGENAVGRQGGFVLVAPVTPEFDSVKKALTEWLSRFGFQDRKDSGAKVFFGDTQHGDENISWGPVFARPKKR
jgi:hypothetical protein